MSADEIREIIRQELAAFFASAARPAANQVDSLTAARIRSAAKSDLADAMAKKQAKRRAA